MILNISHEISQPDKGLPKLKFKLTKAAHAPFKIVLDCYTYDPPGLSKTGNLGKVSGKLAVKNDRISVFFDKLYYRVSGGWCDTFDCSYMYFFNAWTNHKTI